MNDLLSSTAACAISRPRCVIYARVSTEKQQEQNLSIPDQVARARVYAEVQGWEVVEVFVEAGSGRDDSKRPEFRRMIREALLAHRPFDIILVHSFSRFYRDQARSELVRRDLKKNRVQVKSLTQEINDDGGGGTLALSVMGLIDEYQSREGAKHVRRAMEANAREGYRSGGTVAHGYRLYTAEMRGQRPKKKLEIDPDEAALVRDVFARHQKGLGVTAIAIQLNEEGIRTRLGGKWYSSRIHSMLTNEIYAGRAYFKGTDIVTGEKKPRGEWVMIPCPAIIDEATFQRVQEQLARRSPKKTPPRFTTSPVLLGGIAHCGSCGRHLQLATGKKNGVVHRYYKCSGKVSQGSCEGGEPASIPEGLLDATVLGALTKQVTTPDRIQSIVTQVHERRAVDREGASDRVRELKRQLANVARKEKNLWDLAASAGLDAAQGFKEKLAEFDDEKDRLSRNVAAQEALLAEAIKPISRQRAIDVAGKMEKLIGSADNQVRRRYVKALVSRVEVTRDEVRIVGQESTIAEAAQGADVAADMPAERVRGSDLYWLGRQDSNPRGRTAGTIKDPAGSSAAT